MNADGFRQRFDYHFTVNHKIWDNGMIPLTNEQFTQKVEYSIGSVHNQVVHIMNPVYLHKRDIIR